MLLQVPSWRPIHKKEHLQMNLIPVTEVRSILPLGGVDRTLIFNCNTMVAYEQVTKKFFLHTVSGLLDAIYPHGVNGEIAKSPYEVISKVSMEDLRALLWAAMHEYDKDDNPTWPLTVNQVGRLLSLSDIVPAFKSFLKGQTANNPTESEMGESQAESKMKTQHPQTPPIIHATGGERGIELPEDAFNSLPVKQGS